MKKILFVFLALIIFFAVGCSKSEAMINAENLISQIGEVTLDSADEISAAENAVAALNEEEAEKLKNVIGVLEDAKTKYKEIVAAEEAGKIDASIAAIGEVTLDSADAISAARSQYDAASEEAKAKVTDYDTLMAAEQTLKELQAKEKASAVSDGIASIGEVTLSSQETITSLRDSYNNLSDEEKSYVTNVQILDEAEDALDKLKKDEKARRIEELSSDFDIEYDKVQKITWYTPKSMPEYIDTRSYIIPYIGVNDSNGSAWICIRYNYTADSWIFWGNLTIVVDDERYYKSVGYYDTIRDNDTEIWEYYDEILPVNAQMNNEDIQMLKEISESKETIIRFEGDDYYDDLIVKDTDKNTIKTVLELYEALLW